MTVAEVRRNMGSAFSKPPATSGEKKYGRLGPAELRQLKQLEEHSTSNSLWRTYASTSSSCKMCSNNVLMPGQCRRVAQHLLDEHVSAR
jgi:hypothetical protein